MHFCREGALVGTEDGMLELGRDVGWALGCVDGVLVGTTVGCTLGMPVGCTVGTPLGCPVGCVGWLVGRPVG